MLTSPPNPPNFESDYIEVRTTQHGGRSLFAARDIPPGTQVHSSPGPFAHVIYKDYRREVCAQCFAYAASDSAPPEVAQSRVWNTKWKPEGFQGSTAWFCSEDCKEAWEKDEAGPLQMQLDATLTKAQVASRRKGPKPTNIPSLSSAAEITHDAIDQAWKNVDELVASKAQLVAHCATLDLGDAELDIARLLVSAIVRRHVSERTSGITDGPVDSDPHRNYMSWSHFLHLQNNELGNIRERRHILSAHLRIYAFLCNALPKYLLPYIPTTVREVFARDTGNAFGIWDGDRRDEMLGWGVWISASYFNHNCSPNIRKTRQGRTLHFETTRAVSAGEELCISYVDTDQPVAQRQKDLESSWFFRCDCSRCKLESTVTM
ncbi:SET domain-containing protein [Pisolithus croceorrhizus]|nr:SET domain-containing protein [Pisolithus croceorrhizus]